MVITVLQFVGATYLVFHMTKHISHDGTSNDCVLGKVGSFFLLSYFFNFFLAGKYNSHTHTDLILHPLFVWRKNTIWSKDHCPRHH
jgi:hypothetical protein